MQEAQLVVHDSVAPMKAIRKCLNMKASSAENQKENVVMSKKGARINQMFTASSWQQMAVHAAELLAA